MILIQNITHTKKSKFGDKFEMIKFPNNKWYDVEIGEYIMVKYWNNGDWFITNKDHLADHLADHPVPK